MFCIDTLIKDIEEREKNLSREQDWLFHNIIMIYHSDMFLEPHLKNSQVQASRKEKIQTFLYIKGH